jgi:hypothetical protein
MQYADIFLDLNTSPFIGLFYFFICLMVLVFTFIVFFSFYKRKLEKKEKIWQEIVSSVISQIIFFENDGQSPMEINVDEKLLQNSAFRQYFLNEIIHVKKNLFGEPVSNLKKLYETLQFDKDSLKKIHSKKWYIKAKGIQELAIMEQVQYVKEIFRLTNNSNELVRNEAQCALVNFYGFKGFRFLNVIMYPISQWQQIQLLNYLHDAKTTDSRQLKKWLGSKNESVVTLALRLAAFYNSFQVYDEVIKCLQHPNQQIKLNALRYLEKITVDDTAEQIIICYNSSDRIVKLTILSALEQIGSEKQIPFLLKQLHDNDDTIKVAAAKTLSSLHPSGAAFLHTHLFADEYPWKAIFSQIENERAA